MEGIIFEGFGVWVLLVSGGCCYFPYGVNCDTRLKSWNTWSEATAACCGAPACCGGSFRVLLGHWDCGLECSLGFKVWAQGFRLRDVKSGKCRSYNELWGCNCSSTGSWLVYLVFSPSTLNPKPKWVEGEDGFLSIQTPRPRNPTSSSSLPAYM